MLSIPVFRPEYPGEAARSGSGHLTEAAPKRKRPLSGSGTGAEAALERKRPWSGSSVQRKQAPEWSLKLKIRMRMSIESRRIPSQT